jgi:plasmid stability protein
MANKKTISKKAGPGSEQFQLRLPDGMRDHIAAVAARNGRSMNSEVLYALALHLAAEGMTTDERLKSLLRAKLGSALTEIIHELMVEHVRKGIE